MEVEVTSSDGDAKEDAKSTEPVIPKVGGEPIKTVTEFMKRFREMHSQVHNEIVRLKTKGYGPQTFGGLNDPPMLRIPKTKAEKQPTTASSSATGAFKRYICGRAGHIKAECWYSGHPNCNRESVPWNESETGSVWKEFNRDTLPGDPNDTLASRAANKAAGGGTTQTAGQAQNRAPQQHDSHGGRGGNNQNRKRDRSPPGMSLLGF
jgi:hypothetical protein